MKEAWEEVKRTERKEGIRKEGQETGRKEQKGRKGMEEMKR